MADKFDEILDICIDRINRGDSIEDCLADYPEYADELEPLLASMFSTKNAFSFVPQDSVKQGAWQRFSAALRDSERQQEKSILPFPWILGKTRAWAVVATVLVVALVGYFGVTQILPPNVIVTEPDPTGNFAFYISDEQNAIGDFQSLDLTVSKIRLHQENGEWIEFIPETDLVDLTLLQGDMAQQVWRGNVPQGQYSAAVLYATSVTGMLKSTSETVDIKLPSNKLHLDLTFEISTESLTEFVYDVTVIAIGGGRYNLLPVAGESGTDRNIQKVDIPGQGEGQGQEQGQGQGQGQEQGQNSG